MLERPVRINNSTYTRHEITGIDHDFLQGVTIVRVTSTNDNESYNTWISTELNVGVTREELYEWVAGLPQYAPYVNDDTDRLSQVLSVLTDEQLDAFPTDFFPAWKDGNFYAVGNRVSYMGGLYRCIVTHTSQGDWTPDATPSLWVTVRQSEIDPDAIDEWEQPDSTNPYMAGDKVTHNGEVWVSLVDNNVWEPGATGTESLWEVVGEDDEPEGGTVTEPEGGEPEGTEPDGGDGGEPEGTEPDEGDDAGDIEEWQQPDSTNPYMAGDVVSHNGGTWCSLVDGNVWEPGTVGTESLWASE